VGWDCTPRHCDFELSVEIASEVGTHSLIWINFNEPVLAEVTEVLIIVEEKVEFQALHDLGSLNSDEDFIWVEPLSRAARVRVSQVELFGIGSILGLAVDDRNNDVDHLLSRLIESSYYVAYM